LKVITLLEAPQKVLGMHFIGPQAGEVIQGYAAAIKYEYFRIFKNIKLNCSLMFVLDLD